MTMLDYMEQDLKRMDDQMDYFENQSHRNNPDMHAGWQEGKIAYLCFDRLVIKDKVIKDKDKVIKDKDIKAKGKTSQDWIV